MYRPTNVLKKISTIVDYIFLVSTLIYYRRLSLDAFFFVKFYICV